jgi:hypothetical protein
MSNNIDYELVFDQVLKKIIKDPNKPDSQRELAKELLAVSPYEEAKKRKKNGNKLKG